MRLHHGYTYYCAEEPTSSGPATDVMLIVEPGVAAVVRENSHNCAYCQQARRDDETHKPRVVLS